MLFFFRCASKGYGQLLETAKALTYSRQGLSVTLIDKMKKKKQRKYISSKNNKN